MEHVDVLIIGAGLSGIGAACHLRRTAPSTDFAILEGRDNIGGTWDLFKYPGIRSDSDMYTFGYTFRPWSEGKDIASADSILRYLNDTIEEYKLADTIRFGQHVKEMDWSSEDAKWTLTIVDKARGKTIQMSCNFLIGCTGYYKYEHGYLPDFKGMDDYQGQLIHPQQWPEDLDYKGKKILVIGSGATAVTLVPSMAKDAGHITMLQRSPTYVFTRPGEDKIANGLKKILPAMWAHKLIRSKNVLLSMYMFNRARKHPDKVRKFLAEMVQKELGDDFNIDPHFTPTYDPWDQRLCLVPDSDLFKALKDGSASIMTDHIETFTKKGVKLTSGAELEADIIVTATGLEVQFLGGMNAHVDQQKVKVSDLVNYKGMMFEGLPNFTAIFGYTNATWTLKADLTADYVARLLKHMDKHDYHTVMPVMNEEGMTLEPIVGLQSGYITRAAQSLPKQGDKMPWRNRENYLKDYMAIKWGKFDDGVLRFE